MSRVSAAELVIRRENCGWGCVIELEGSEADLLKSGAAHPGMFEAVRANRSKTKSGSTEFGDRFSLKALPRQRWHLCLRLRPEVLDPWSDSGDRALGIAYRVELPRAEAAVKEILDRIAGDHLS